MKSDTIKAVTSSATALIIVGGGLFMIYQLTTSHVISGDAALAILGPLIGGAAAWVFGRDSTAGGQRAAERAVTLGANAAAGTIPQPPAGS